MTACDGIKYAYLPPIARRCVYVSCNPATQARDIAILCGSIGHENNVHRFELVSLQVVDMFPHTDHAETVAVLEKTRP
jgi:tRNA/tmRNA/rRNA uracil-C5-methylase (TrmA/RlmC/RlmD family)